MAADSEFVKQSLERRVFLSGALGALAVGASACSSSVSKQAVAERSTLETGAKPLASDPNDAIGNSLDWPRGVAPIQIGSVAEVRSSIEFQGGFGYFPEARAWLLSYPEEFQSAALKVYPEVMHEGLSAGLLALYQKCPHLGCRVPECGSSGAFECPCHGSQFSAYGEHFAGPSPRGMDLIPMTVSDDIVTLDVAAITLGLEHGTNITDWSVTGPSCLGESSE